MHYAIIDGNSVDGYLVTVVCYIKCVQIGIVFAYS